MIDYLEDTLRRYSNNTTFFQLLAFRCVG